MWDFSLFQVFFSLDLTVIAFLSSVVMKGLSFALIYFCFKGQCSFRICINTEEKVSLDILKISREYNILYSSFPESAVQNFYSFC